MDPIQALIAANPTSAVLHTPSTRATYDPSAAAELTLRTPGNNPGTTITGAFSNVVQQGLDVAYKATFTIAVGDLSSANAKAGELTLDVGGVTYQVAKARKRFFQGAQNGWTLELQ